MCEHYAITLPRFYASERQAERGARQALSPQPRGRQRLSPDEEQQQAEIAKLRAVIAELSTENLELKKGRWRKHRIVTTPPARNKNSWISPGAPKASHPTVRAAKFSRTWDCRIRPSNACGRMRTMGHSQMRKSYLSQCASRPNRAR